MKARSQRSLSWIRQVLFFIAGGSIGVIGLVIFLIFFSDKKIWPLVSIANTSVGGLNQGEAIIKLIPVTSVYTLELQYGQAHWNIPHEVWHFDIPTSVNHAMQTGFFWGQAQIPMTVTIDDDAWTHFMEETRTLVEIPSTIPLLSYQKGTITLQNGTDGIGIDEATLRQTILTHLTLLDSSPIEIPTHVIIGSLSSEQQSLVQDRAKKMIGKKLELVVDDVKIILQTPELLSFLSFFPQDKSIDPETVTKYVNGIATRFERPAENALLRVEHEKVVEFAPGKDGIVVKIPETTDSMVTTLQALLDDGIDKSIPIVVDRTPPKVATGDVNTLGLQERVGRGESFYAHSIANRVFNVGFTAGKINGILIPPGEEFSFLKTVGDITAAAGFKPAYVISGGRTVLGDGGGVCQVSTTLFRAAMNAGLPIVERWAHAYRVGYYEQNSKPGFDATVYYPSKDFRFKNDTEHYLLLYVVNDLKTLHLTIDIYGTSDGRVATVSPGRLSSITPPPPDLIQDDPSLPVGTRKQVDWSAWGGKAAFDYKVERDGETIFSRTFTSVYKPWQNVYLRGTGH